METSLESTKEEFPLKRCQRDGSKGWKWGDNGYCYTQKEEGSDEAAKEKARKQGRAIKRRQNKNASYSLLSLNALVHSPELVTLRTDVSQTIEDNS